MKSEEILGSVLERCNLITHERSDTSQIEEETVKDENFGMKN